MDSLFAHAHHVQKALGESGVGGKIGNDEVKDEGNRTFTRGDAVNDADVARKYKGAT